MHIGSFFMHIFSATTHRKNLPCLSTSKHYMSCLPRLSPGMLRHHTYMRTSFSGTWVAPGLLERHTMCILVHSSCISFLLPPIEKKTCHAYPPQSTKCLVCHVSAQECCDITPICARASQAPGLHPGYLRDIQCAYWFILHAYLFCYHP